MHFPCQPLSGGISLPMYPRKLLLCSAPWTRHRGYNETGAAKPTAPTGIILRHVTHFDSEQQDKHPDRHAAVRRAWAGTGGEQTEIGGAPGCGRAAPGAVGGSAPTAVFRQAALESSSRDTWYLLGALAVLGTLLHHLGNMPPFQFGQVSGGASDRTAPGSRNSAGRYSGSMAPWPASSAAYQTQKSSWRALPGQP